MRKASLLLFATTLGICGCQPPRNVIVPAIPPSDILALAPDLALIEKPIQGDNGLTKLINEFELMPYELRSFDRRTTIESLSDSQKKLLSSESEAFLKIFDDAARLEWQFEHGKYYGYSQKGGVDVQKIGQFVNLASLRAAQIGDTMLTKKLVTASAKLVDKIEQACNSIDAYSLFYTISKTNEKSLRDVLRTRVFKQADLKDLMAIQEKLSEPTGFEPAMRGQWEEYAKNVATFRFPQDASPVDYYGNEEEAIEYLNAYRGNKKPFDQIATAQVGAEFFRLVIKEKNYARADEIAKTILPEFIHDDSEFFEEEEVEESEEQVKENKKKELIWKRETPNSFGIVLNSSLLQISASSYSKWATALWLERDLTRVMLGCLLFEAQTGHLPLTLNDLDRFNMSRGITDVQSGKPFGYDPKRGVVWSVGKDGKDDGGEDPTEQPESNAKDRVVRIK